MPENMKKILLVSMLICLAVSLVGCAEQNPSSGAKIQSGDYTKVPGGASEAKK
jgi:outer membrane lipoprotein-sorting protein